MFRKEKKLPLKIQEKFKSEKNLIVVIIFLLVSGCSSVKCSKFYTYSAKKIDLKGITLKLKSQGVDLGDVGIAEVSIDPKYVVANNKLQELDLLQYAMCNQINGLSKGSIRDNAIVNYTKVLEEMLKIAQNPALNDTIKNK
ncbi:hypothetical protein [Flavobacterium panici]|nr:hypothetical protein [Flavobacterium panici]